MAVMPSCALLPEWYALPHWRDVLPRTIPYWVKSYTAVCEEVSNRADWGRWEWSNR